MVKLSKERPATKKSVEEVLKELKQGQENARAFGERCRPTAEDMKKRVVYHNRGLETDPSPDIQKIFEDREVERQRTIQERMSGAIKKANRSRRRSSPVNSDFNRKVGQGNCSVTAQERLDAVTQRARVFEQSTRVKDLDKRVTI